MPHSQIYFHNKAISNIIKSMAYQIKIFLEHISSHLVLVLTVRAYISLNDVISNSSAVPEITSFYQVILYKREFGNEFIEFQCRMKGEYTHYFDIVIIYKSSHQQACINGNNE